MMSLRHRSRRAHDWLDRLMLVATLPALGMLLLEFGIHQQAVIDNFFEVYYWALLALFAAEFGWRIWNAPSKIGYLRQNWIELPIILFPVTRVLLVFEVPLVILVDEFQRLVPVRHKSVIVAVLVLIIVVTVSSQLILVAERPYPQSHIHTYAEALWWATVGVSTIGIGDVVPISTLGRVITIFLMLFGVLVFGLITASITAYFAERDEKHDIEVEEQRLERDMRGEESDIMKELRTIERRLDRLETAPK